MKSDAVWALLLGAAVALASTLLAQWASLAYQTRRQREARRADFQRSALVQVRDLLLELSEAMGGVAAVRYEATQRADWDGALPSYHPAVAAVRSLADRLEIVAAAVEDEQLRIRDRQPSAVLSRVFAGRADPYMPQGWVNRRSSAPAA